MKLIIAEKPSLARNIVSAIGNMNKCNGYFEGNGYIVTYRDGSQEALTKDELDAKLNKERFGMKEK